MNVLFFFSDEHNPRMMGAAGHPFLQTPTLDGLAERGAIFDSAYCPSPLSAPCRASLFTGRPVHEIGAWDNASSFEGEHPTWMEAMRSAGVFTFHTGKLDAFPGTDMCFGLEVDGGYRSRPGDVNFQRQPTVQIRHGARRRLTEGYGVDARSRDGRLVDNICRWLREEAPATKSPWIASVHTSAPHFPFKCPQPYWDSYADHADVPAHDGSSDAEQHPFWQDLRRHFETIGIDERHVGQCRRGYYGAVTLVDDLVSRVLRALDDSGSTEETLVLYSSDHGESLGEHGLWYKCNLYEDSVRVPLIATGPGIAPGRRITTPVNLLDVVATLFDAVEQPCPGFVQGRSLLPLLRGDEQADRLVFSEYHGHGQRNSSYMVRRGRWKLIYCVGAPNQLYDLASDPDEMIDLVDSPQGAIVADALEQDLRRLCDPEEVAARSLSEQAEKLDRLRRSGHLPPAD